MDLLEKMVSGALCVKSRQEETKEAYAKDLYPEPILRGPEAGKLSLSYTPEASRGSLLMLIGSSSINQDGKKVMRFGCDPSGAFASFTHVETGFTFRLDISAIAMSLCEELDVLTKNWRDENEAQ